MLEELDFSREIKKIELRDILKKEASKIHIKDIMNFHGHLVVEGKYVQKDYLKEYLEAYVKGFILRIKEIKDDNDQYLGFVDREELKKAVDTLKAQEENVEEVARDLDSFKVYELVSLYTTFIKDEPIHIVGTLFPGGFRVKSEGQVYYCPVKEVQKDNPRAVCGFCIALQDEDV